MHVKKPWLSYQDTPRREILLDRRALLAETFSLTGANNSVATLGATGANSTLCLTSIGLRKNDPVAGLTMFQGSTAHTGSTLFKYALLKRISASTAKVVAVTAESTASEAVNGFVPVDFTAVYLAPKDDTYYCAALSVVATTQPTFLRGVTLSGIGKQFLGSTAYPKSGVRACASVAAQTDITLAATLTLVDGVNAFWFGAYSA